MINIRRSFLGITLPIIMAAFIPTAVQADSNANALTDSSIYKLAYDTVETNETQEHHEAVQTDDAGVVDSQKTVHKSTSQTTSQQFPNPYTGQPTSSSVSTFSKEETTKSHDISP